MNTNDMTLEVVETSIDNSLFNDQEISFLISNLSPVQKIHRCSICCVKTNRLNQGFHHMTEVKENFLVCDACFASTSRVLIPTVLLGYYTKLRQQQGLMGIN